MSKNSMIIGMWEDIERAARNVSYEWPGVSTEDDLAQEVALHILDRFSVEATERLHSADPAARNRILGRMASQVASKEKDSYEYFTGNFQYSTAQVRRLLEQTFLYDNNDPTGERASTKVDLGHGLDVLEETAPQYADILVRRYWNGEAFDRSGTRRRTLGRAVAALTREMNRSFRRRHAEHGGVTPGKGRR